MMTVLYHKLKCSQNVAQMEINAAVCRIIMENISYLFLGKLLTQLPKDSACLMYIQLFALSRLGLDLIISLYTVDTFCHYVGIQV